MPLNIKSLILGIGLINLIFTDNKCLFISFIILYGFY